MLDIDNIDDFGISEGDIGILFVLFPTVLFIKDTDKDFQGVKVYLGKNGVNSKKIKYLPYVRVDKALNKKEGLINFLKASNISIPVDLLNLDEELFMESIKYFVYFRESSLVDINMNIFSLLDNLGNDFLSLYNAYKRMNVSYLVLFSILLTFFNKSFGKSMNSYFNKKLICINKNIKMIMSNIITYSWSSKSEIDFLRFLYSINKDFIK